MDSTTELLDSSGLEVTYAAGLTFPISKLLFPLSNFLMRHGKGSKLKLSMIERTKKSGTRDVPMKTAFPLHLGAAAESTHDVSPANAAKDIP
jgi:hypothetical protein